MTFKASLMFAKRLLFPLTGKKSNARRSLTGACLCIGISLIPLVVVLTVSNGMIEGMTERMISLSSSHISASIHPELSEAQTAESLTELAEKLKQVEGVKQVYPELQGVALAAGASGRTGAQIRSVRQDIFSVNKAYTQLLKVVEGNPDLSKMNSAVIGKKLAEILNLHAGDSFRIISTKTLPNKKIIPKITRFTVSAVVSSGYQELDALWVFVSLNSGYSILPVRSSQVLVGMETDSPFGYNLDVVLSRVEQKVPNYTRVSKWSEINAAQFENFSSTQMMLLVIMLLIVLVASVNIASALVMLVMERRKEIAILKSLGASSGGITVSFLITGLCTGALGVLLGLPAGLLCAVNFNSIISLIEKVISLFTTAFYVLKTGTLETSVNFHLLDPAFYLQDIPLSIPLTELIIISSGTLILSLLVSAIPAIKAGKEKPIETLRKI